MPKVDFVGRACLFGVEEIKFLTNFFLLFATIGVTFVTKRSIRKADANDVKGFIRYFFLTRKKMLYQFNPLLYIVTNIKR